MVHVRIRMLGTFREASGRGEDELAFQGEVDVARVIQRLIDEYGEGLGRGLLDPVLKSPLPNALILLNGVEINNLEGLETPIRDDDILTLLAVAHGG